MASFIEPNPVEAVLVNFFDQPVSGRGQLELRICCIRKDR